MAVLRAAALRPTASQRAPALARFQSGSSTHTRGQPGLASTSEPPQGSHSEGAMIRKEGAAEGQPNHNPDYNVATDYRTS